MRNAAMETNDPILLTCWKDIARYMGKGVRTVQRWELTLDLPVRRPRGNGYKSAVVARPADLDVWLASRWERRALREGQAPAMAQPGLRGNLCSTIEAARQLRAENHALVRELRSKLATLVRSCHEISQQGLSGNSN
jgi:hypothetical protein